MSTMSIVKDENGRWHTPQCVLYDKLKVVEITTLPNFNGKFGKNKIQPTNEECCVECLQFKSR